MIGEIPAQRDFLLLLRPFRSPSSVASYIIYLAENRNRVGEPWKCFVRENVCIYTLFPVLLAVPSLQARTNLLLAIYSEIDFHKIGTKRFSSCNPLCFFGPRSPPNCFLSIYLSVSIWRSLDVCPKFMCLIRMNIKIITWHARVAAGERLLEKSLKWHKLAIASELPPRGSSGARFIVDKKINLR